MPVLGGKRTFAESRLRLSIVVAGLKPRQQLEKAMSVSRAIMCWFAAAAVIGVPTSKLRARPQSIVESQIDGLFAGFDGAKPGCAVGVYRAGDVLFAKGYGLADVVANVSIGPSTVFNVASLSKQFTAFAIALLVSEGRLSLDAEVQKHVPELPRFATPITVRHLIHHTSGLRDYGSLMELTGWRLDQPLSKSDVIGMLKRQRGLNFTPGDRHEYNNTNYVLLALIVERVSGQRFRDFAADRIFRPLGMTATQVRDDPAGPTPKRAANYTLTSSGSYAANRVWDRAYAAGVSNVHTSIKDLAKWDRNFFSPTVGDDALIQTVYSPGKLSSGKSTSYAYGLELGSHRGSRTFAHSGIGGGSFYILRLPEQRLSVATLCNRYGVGPGAPDTWKLSRAVADIFLASLSKPRAIDAVPKLAPAIRVPAIELARYAGTYWRTDGPPITIRLENSQLFELSNGKPYPLIPVGEGKFRDPEGTATYTFAGPERHTLTYYEIPADYTETGERRAQWTPTLADLTLAVGRYCTPEVPVCWSLLLVGNNLVLRRAGFPDRVLSAATPNVFSVVDADEIGTRSMRMVLQRAPNASISGFSVFRGRLGGLLFERA